MTMHALAPDEIDQLLAAFAIDALDDAEHEQIVEYLTEHPEARQEVDSYRKAAAKLRSLDGPSPEVWDRITTQIETEKRSVPVVASLDERRQRRARYPKSIAVAAATVALTGTALALTGSNETSDQAVVEVPAAVVDAAQSAARSPDAQLTTVPVGDGKGTVNVVLLPSGVGYVVSTTVSNAAELVKERLYAITDSVPVLLAILNKPLPIAFRAPPGTIGLVISPGVPQLIPGVPGANPVITTPGVTVPTLPGGAPSVPGLPSTPSGGVPINPIPSLPSLPITLPVTLPSLPGL